MLYKFIVETGGRTWRKMTKLGILLGIASLMIILGISAVIWIRNGEKDLMWNPYAGYYVGTVTAIGQKYVEIRIIPDDGGGAGVRDAKLRIDSYRFYSGRPGVWNSRKEEMPRIGEEYIFYYIGIKGSSEYALERIVPTSIIGEGDGATFKEGEHEDFDFPSGISQ